MDYRRFMLFNLLGGLFWAIGVTLAGFFLGSIFPPEVLDRYFVVIVLVVIVLSVLPTAIHLWQDNRPAILGWLRARLNRAPVE
jgi:membrane-associated protein